MGIRCCVTARRCGCRRFCVRACRGIQVTGYQSSSPFGLIAPAHTPDHIINKLNQEIVRTLQRADVRERLFNAGMEVIAGTPAQLTTTMKSEMSRWGKLIKDLGIREE